MLKKIYFLSFCLAIASCSTFGGSKFEHAAYCPNVYINRSDAYVSQIEGYKNPVKIELYGYEGYCSQNKDGRSYATVTPLFRVLRLDHSRNEIFIGFDYMYKTSKGPEAFLGSKVFAVQEKVPEAARDYKFRGKPIVIRVPSVDDGTFEISLKMKLSSDEKLYNDITFDLN